MKINNNNTGDFIITENPKNPIILMIFNLFENNERDIFFNIENNNIKFRDINGSFLIIEIDNSKLKNKLNSIDKIMIIEIDQDYGDVARVYISKKKPT